MKKLLLILALASPAQAQELTCPPHYPEVPGVRLLGGGMHDGPAHEYERMGTCRKERDGHSTQYDFDASAVKWFVCVYEGRREWWTRIDSRATDCRLTSRGKHKLSVKLVCK